MSRKQGNAHGAMGSGKGDEDRDLDANIKTFITFNKGGEWRPIPAPENDSQGKKSKCYTEDGCSLHLQLYSSSGILAPVYSQKSAVGIVLGVGNVGKQLNRNKDASQNTYMSRDGGLNWFEIKKGPHIYEIGDHGSIIAMAQSDKPTKSISFTWNEGLNWSDLEIIDKPMLV